MPEPDNNNTVESGNNSSYSDSSTGTIRRVQGFDDMRQSASESTNEQKHFDKQRLRPSIHPTYARLICAQLRQQGFEDDDIFLGTHLAWNQILGDNRLLSFEQIRRLILRSIEITERPWLGLAIGSITQASAHGPLGYGAVAARNVGEALGFVSRLVELRQQITDFTIETNDERCVLHISERFDFGDVRYFIHDLLIATIIKVAETVAGNTLNEGIINLPRPKPTWQQEYKTCFPDQKINYGTQGLSVDFPYAYLDLPSLTSDPSAFKTAELECQRLLKLQESGGDLSQRIRNHFLDKGPPYPTMETLADQLGLSKRTLIRKLKQQDTSYQELLDDVRKELAAWHLLNSKLPVDAIADLLGYIDTTNFSRTFRRWFGMTPREFRQAKENNNE